MSPIDEPVNASIRPKARSQVLTEKIIEVASARNRRSTRNSNRFHGHTLTLSGS